MTEDDVKLMDDMSFWLEGIVQTGKNNRKLNGCIKKVCGIRLNIIISSVHFYLREWFKDC